MKRMTTVVLLAAVAVGWTTQASAAMVCAPINCVKTLRDGLAAPGSPVHVTPDGLGDDVGFHNSPLPPTGAALAENRIASYVFQLPALNGGTLVGASLETFLDSNTAQGFNLDVVALKIDSDFHPLPADYEASIALLGSSQLVADNLATPASPAGAALPTVSGGNLLAYLQNNYVEGAYIHFTFVPDSLQAQPSGLLDGNYIVTSPFAASDGVKFCLDIQPVPEPAALALTVFAAVGTVVRRRQGARASSPGRCVRR